MDEAWRGRRWVVETDIANCFSAIPQDRLMQAVEERVCDQAVLKLLRAMLRAGVMEDGQVRRPVTGTPQGGVISPLMCNVYLHRIDRAWDVREHGVLVRFADDALVMCKSRAAGRGRAGAAAGAAGRTRVGTEGGQDPDRAPGGGWGRVRFPRLSPPAGARAGPHGGKGVVSSSPAGPRTGPCSTLVTGSGN